MKQNKWWIIAFGVLFWAVYAFTFDPKLDLNGDNANYIQLAKHISEGHGYSSLTQQGYLPAGHYPPGYSAFLAFFMILGIKSLIFFKILNGVLLFASLLLILDLVNRVTKRFDVALLAVVLCSFTPQLLHFSNIVMSEMLFLFLTVLAFWALSKQKPYFVLAVLAACASYYVRTVGMAVIVSVAVFYFFRKEWWRGFGSMGLSVLLLLPWSLRNAAAGIESRYFGTIMTVNPWRPEEGTISSFSEMIQKMLTNFDETVLKGFRELLFPFIGVSYNEPSSFFAVILGLLVLALVVFGAWRMRKLRWAMLAFLAANIGLFMLWHGGNGSRYVVPIAPYVFVLFFLGVYELNDMVFKPIGRRTKYAVAAGAILLLPMIPPMKALAEQSNMPVPPNYANYFEIARIVEKDAPKPAVVCCRKPELFNYYAPHVFTVNYKYTQDAKELIQDLIDKNVDYVVLEQLGFSSTGRYLFPALQAYPECFPVLLQLPNPDTYLLRFNRELAKSQLQ